MPRRSARSKPSTAAAKPGRTPKPNGGTSKPTGYSGKLLAEKLGMKPGLRCAAIEAPDDYAALLGASLPFDTSLEEETYDLLHFFAPSALALEHALRVLEPRLATDGMLWVSWPKKSSGVATDLDEAVVRATGLATGLVDVKVCAVNATWSALKFVRRLRDR